VVNIAGVSALDNSATLSSAGVSYIILKDWSERGEGEDLMSLFNKLNAALGAIPEADILVMPPPPIQGVGNDAGFSAASTWPSCRASPTRSLPMPRRSRRCTRRLRR